MSFVDPQGVLWGGGGALYLLVLLLLFVTRDA